MFPVCPQPCIRYHLVRRPVPQWIRPPSTSELRLLYKAAFPSDSLCVPEFFHSIPLSHSVPLRRSTFNMGILGRKAPPPTTLDLDDAKHPSTQLPGDPEKSDKEVQVENDTIGTRAHNIDPELERRVVRKLDWHVPPLVAFLCESRYHIRVHGAKNARFRETLCLTLVYRDRSSLLPRSLQHWQCQNCRYGERPGSQGQPIQLVVDDILHRIHPLPISRLHVEGHKSPSLGLFHHLFLVLLSLAPL